MKLLLAMLVALAATSANAHKSSDAYLTLTWNDASISGQWDIALRDLDAVLGLDGNGDGEITWGELRARHADIAAHALAHLTIASDGQRCGLRVTEHLADAHTDGAYAVMRLVGTCPAHGPTLAVTYTLFADSDPQHRGLVNLVTPESSQSYVLGGDRNPQTLGGSDNDMLRQGATYLREGVWHIWLGFDHILFLVSLLLPAVLIRRDGAWRPSPSFRAAFVDVAKVVTAFTLAHSITLSLAVLDIVALPSRWIESAIALSVVLAALNNLYPVVANGRWIAAFGFGLLHGFGFASALADLGLPTSGLAVSLLGFNLGVEIGQLAIVTLFLPIAFALRDTTTYQRVLLRGGSAVIAGVAAIWLAERALNVPLFASLAVAR